MMICKTHTVEVLRHAQLPMPLTALSWDELTYCVLCLPHPHIGCTCRELWPTVPRWLCTWHVKQAWIKNLNSKVRSPDSPEILTDMCAIMHGVNIDQMESAEQVATVVDGMLSAFMSKWGHYTAFAEYFRKEWLGRPGRCECCMQWRVVGWQTRTGT